MKRVAVIGNACSGKTTLSKVLAAKFSLPIVHVDSIQFLSGMRLRSQDETRKILRAAADGECWLIDGFGPLNTIENRFEKADLIVFLRLPLWLNYWWCIKRQFWGLFVRRAELPENCFEATIPQTLRLFRSISNVHHRMWPQLDRIFAKPEFRSKVRTVHAKAELQLLLQNPDLLERSIRV